VSTSEEKETKHTQNKIQTQGNLYNLKDGDDNNITSNFGLADNTSDLVFGMSSV
jgi:hypothetical protein